MRLAYAGPFPCSDSPTAKSLIADSGRLLPGRQSLHVNAPGCIVLKAMIVEDSDFVRAVLRNLLTEIEGICVVGEYVDAVAAISAVSLAMPDVMLLDIQLNKGTGMEVLKHVRGGCAEVKVIMVSNYPEPVVRNHYLAAGAYRFFDKSHEIAQLRRVLVELSEQLQHK